jgi:two-component system response regulator MtrA
VTAQRILLVEDDASIRELTTLGLRAAGYAVTAVETGTAALDAFVSDPPDAVILDVMLPGADGLAVCRSIRAASAVPVIMVTARTDTLDVVAGLEAGADDYIRKPFEMPEVLARLRAALRRAGSADVPPVLRLGPLTIDVGAHVAARDGAELPVSHTEFRLLVELAQRPGQVFSRQQLLDLVWGYDYLGDSRLVDVAIQRLRSKIETDPARPELILTVRGSGYKAVRATPR